MGPCGSLEDRTAKMASCRRGRALGVGVIHGYGNDIEKTVTEIYLFAILAIIILPYSSRSYSDAKKLRILGSKSSILLCFA